MILGAGYETGTRIGFWYDSYGIDDILIAVSSPKKVFNINDITLEIHFGWDGGMYDRILKDGMLPMFT